MHGTHHPRTEPRRGRFLPASSFRPALGLVVSALVVGCDGGTTPLTSEEPEERVQQLTVNAAAGWSPIRLGPPLEPSSVSSLGASTDWHLAFFVTSVVSNGGDGGPAGTEVHCLCQNSGASDSRIQALTAADADALFESVGEAMIPTDPEAWKTEELLPVIRDWYRYDVTTHTVTPDLAAVWKLRLAGEAGFAKLRVTQIEGGGQGGPGRIRLEYALQAAPGEPLGEIRHLWVEPGEGTSVTVDLVAGRAPAGERWDVALDGWRIRVNGGVSGSGGAGAVRVAEPFEAIEDAADLNVRLYAADGVTGGFSQGEEDRRWFRYNLQGNRQVWPTYNVYLVRDEDRVWKVQLLNYYGEDGSPRQITLRVALLRGEEG